ncbi:hypothetical protein BOTBODRAFT_176853 [Botryobasidium botryosum FD-172 SS1]|uniref:Uncharacterized protein n=1 Tax=Botryobasidium botryosum (strain FD-172 SS1) TaxID=930990 RepID=A0A067M7Y1_BOTB1|nr:hypothetical protein BOTBODRAFT_176853 [Botryobasidium botryosum FD-172 SS1]
MVYRREQPAPPYEEAIAATRAAYLSDHYDITTIGRLWENMNIRAPNDLALPDASMEGLRQTIYGTNPSFAVHQRFIYNRQERDAIIDTGLAELFAKAQSLYEQGNCDIIVLASRPDANYREAYYSRGILNDPLARQYCESFPALFADLARERRGVFEEKNGLRINMRRHPATPSRRGGSQGISSSPSGSQATRSVPVAGHSAAAAAAGFPTDVTEYLVRRGVNGQQRQDLVLAWQWSKQSIDGAFSIEDVLSEMMISPEARSFVELKLLRSLNRITA